MMKTRKISKLSILNATPGINKELTVVRYGTKGSFPKVYLQAAIHADEFPGILTLNHLQILLDEADAKGKIIGEIVIVPYANPVGLGQFLNGYQIGRFDFDMTGNFNRDYLDLASLTVDVLADKLTDDIDENTIIIRQSFRQAIDNNKPKLEVEDMKKSLLSLSFDSDYVLDLHCDTVSMLHMYTNESHVQTSKLLANHMSCPILLVEDNPGGMAFDEANASAWWRLRDLLAERGIHKPIHNSCFASTVELRGQWDVTDEINANDAQNIFNFLRSIDCISGIKTNPTIQENIEKPLAGVDTLKAPVGGLVVYKKNLGDRVKKGDVIAEIVDYSKPPSESERIQLTSLTDGILFTKININLVRPGHTVAKIAGDEILDYRTGNLLAF